MCRRRTAPADGRSEGKGAVQMDNHGKKMIAPIVISVIVILYFAVYFFFLTTLLENRALKLLLIAVPVLIAVTMICICVQRIREIKGGEEDDLGQY